MSSSRFQRSGSSTPSTTDSIGRPLTQAAAELACRLAVRQGLRERVRKERSGSQAACPSSAVEYVADTLASPGLNYLLASGRRGSSAFRVVRERSASAVVRLGAPRASVLTRPPDIVPTGQVVWSEVATAAASRRVMWRDRFGPQLGDALATARTRLRLVRKR